MIKITDFIIESTRKLATAGCDAPRTDVVAILEFVLGQDRSWILTHDDQFLKKTDLEKIDKLIKRREKHEPLAYILGKKEFYGREFVITPDVLIPRPESENIIEIAKNIKSKNFIDIGTGSGCTGITLAIEIPQAIVTITDISPDALAIAKKNTNNLKVDIELIETDLLNNIKITKTTCLVANLPYVPDGLITSDEINAEPKLALFAGVDGMDVYKKFWEQVKSLKIKPSWIITESLENQHMIMAKLALNNDYINTQTMGLVQKFEYKK